MTTTLVWDASGLLHASKADRLDVLGEHARGPADDPWSNVTTTVVEAELARLGHAVPEWVTVEPDTIQDQVTLATWMRRTGAGMRDMGETTVLNLASSRGWTAVIDDSKARKVARRYGVATHGTLWVIASPVVRGECSEAAASGLADALLDSGARFSFGRGEFIAWARKNGLIPDMGG